MRAFIAIPLSKETRENLVKVQSQFKTFDARITWVKPEILHITLEFLGDIEEQKTAGVSTAIEKACQQIKPFELNLEGLKLIPNIYSPRVIAVSVGGDLGSLQKLKNQIRVELESLGFKLEQEKTPHITLGRIKEKFTPQTRKHFLQIAKESHFNDFKSAKPSTVAADAASSTRVNVRKIVLVKSTLTQTGPIYTRIAEIPLTRSH